MHICRYGHDDTLPDRLRELLEDRAFAYFRDGTVSGADKTGDAAAHTPGGASRSAASESLRHSLDTVLTRANVAPLTAGDDDLAEAAAHKCVAWVGEVWTAGGSAEGLLDEERLMAATRRRGFDDPSVLDAALDLVGRRYAHRADAWRYFAALLRSDLDASGTEARVAAMACFLQTWKVCFDTRRREVEQRILTRGLMSFLRQLRSDLEEAQEAQHRVRDMLGVAGGFWDLLKGEWDRVEWDSLEEAARLLKEQPTIQRLARILGRGAHAEPQYARVVEERAVAEYHVHDEVLGRSQVEGIRMGHAVETMLSSEAALLSDEATELVFTKRFADDGLLSLDYRRLDEHVQVTSRTESVERLVPQQRGPIIACIDTSGSMKGKPERIAKAASMALAREALREGRRCYLISFSTEIRTLEVTDLPRDIPELSRFLAHSFHGGTDLRPALREALRMLREERFRRADVIAVSDFQIPKIADRMSGDLQAARDAYATVFHSLTVNEKPVSDPLNLFDFRWHYDISHPESEGVVLGRFARTSERE
ncbi:MAG: VWA domain-containing protein [Spirochaetaceae bacterium]